MKPLILIACFLPLALIWIIMKFSLWIVSENYVRTESKKSHGLYVANPYEDVDKEEEEFTDRTDYR